VDTGRSIFPFSGICETTSYIADTNELGGYPVLQLHDTADDFENSFTALHDGSWPVGLVASATISPTLNRNFGTDDPADFRMVSGILRLATKYVVDSLRANALAHRSIAWPNSLKGWNAREDLARANEMGSGPGMSNIYFPSSKPPSLISSIQFSQSRSGCHQSRPRSTCAEPPAFCIL